MPLVRRVRIVHRHRALALADEHAGPDMNRALVAYDDALMRRRARARAVRPEDDIARKHPAPAVIATDVDACRVQTWATAGAARMEPRTEIRPRAARVLGMVMASPVVFGSLP